MSTRYPAVAGAFYPDDPKELKTTVQEFITSACLEYKHKLPSINPRILISPHAGYVYSGQVAGYTYCALSEYLYNNVIQKTRHAIDMTYKAKNTLYKNNSKDAILSSNQSAQARNTKTPDESLIFIILAPAHTIYFNGIAIDTNNLWLTPLGKILVNNQISNEFSKLNFTIYDTRPHIKEHAIEVQLPFLQVATMQLQNKLNKAKQPLNLKFSIVPIVIGDIAINQLIALSNLISDLLKQHDNLYLIISSDLSHYLPYELAKQVDLNTISLIIDNISAKKPKSKKHVDAEYADVTNDINTTSIANKQILPFKPILPEQACGAYGINTAILTARNLNYKARLLKYLNSGDTAGPKTQVVGYASIIIGQEHPSKNLKT